MRKKDNTIYSAFVLNDDQTWDQPSFRVKGPRSAGRIAQALVEASRRAFVVYGLLPDPDAPECCVRLLNTKTKQWELVKHEAEHP